MALLRVSKTSWAILAAVLCVIASAVLSVPRSPRESVRTAGRADGPIHAIQPPKESVLNINHVSQMSYNKSFDFNPHSTTLAANTNIQDLATRRFELADLVPLASIQPGRLEVVLNPALDSSSSALVKFSMDAHESNMYQLLHDMDVTPRFLGHVTEQGRVVGLLTEFVGDWTSLSSSQQSQQQIRTDGEDKENERQLGDVEPKTGPPVKRREACLDALRRIHARGIAHGDAHGENCLLRPDGSAVLIDFELALETTSREEFERDLWIMSHTVED